MFYITFLMPETLRASLRLKTKYGPKLNALLIFRWLIQVTKFCRVFLFGGSIVELELELELGLELEQLKTL